MEKDKHIVTSLNFLLVATFLGQMNIGVVGITVPIYAFHLGASPFLIGVVGATGGMIYSFAPLAFGILSDKMRRKVFISASMISYGLSCIFYSLAEDPLTLALIRVLEWTSIAAFWPTMEALVADVGEEKIEETLKKFNISWGSGMIVGPVVGGSLVSTFGIKAPFLLSLLVSLSLGMLNPVIVREPVEGRLRSMEAIYSKEEGSLNSQCSLITALSSIFLFSSVGGVIQSLFPAYAAKLGFRAEEIGVMMFIFGASRMATFYRAPKIGAKLSKIGMFLAGSSALALASALMTNIQDSIGFSVCFVVFGFGEGASYAASISFILRKWGSSRGYAAGIFESLIGLGYFLGPLIGGMVSEYALNAPYVYSSIMSLAVFFTQLAISRRRRSA